MRTYSRSLRPRDRSEGRKSEIHFARLVLGNIVLDVDMEAKRPTGSLSYVSEETCPGL
jgi:hypothetical protein